MESNLHKKALILSYITVGYNIGECLISIFAGVMAGSIALIGFGLDSLVESLSGSVMIWRFRRSGKISEEDEEELERRSARMIAATFFILGAYVLYESAKKLIVHEIPHPSLLGIAIALVSMITMPVLFYFKYKIGKKIGSRSLVADSKQTLACMFLSIALLIGLGLNYLFGIWQADPIVGLVIVIFLFKEGYQTWKEEEICGC
jgi:cation diffusion facilitator family transporter